MSGKLALVTGANGFIAGHVVDQLLQEGYRVRGTVRSAKIESLREAVNISGLEFIQIDDVAKADFTEALKGVDVIMHVASPLAGKASMEDTMSSAVEGTLNLLRQAEKAGIEKIVVTSSIAAVIDPFRALEFGFTGIELTESNWGDVTMDDARAQKENPFFVYCCAKNMAEKAAWTFASQHPRVDIATILPSFVYGPFAPHFPAPSKENLSTNAHPYTLINGEFPPMFPPFFVDVRDIAKAHLLALDLPRATPEEKRFLIDWGNYPWTQAAEYLKKARPGINVPEPATFPDFPGPLATLNSSRSRKVLKLEYISPEKTLDDFIESMAKVEKSWAQASDQQ